ncbi:MAG: hypothetical protein J1F40_08760 [Prevotellaceae bacterium]|nr:hypothetical protein [Prevotellaceae bacterium]
MKKNIKSVIVVAVLGTTSTAIGQNLNTGYFNEGYIYRHELNPAYGNEQTYVALPGVSNVNIGMNSNLKLSNLLHNVDGKTALFLNPQVDTQEFLSGIHDKNRISENIKLQVLGGGFRSWGGYNTAEFNVRQNLYLNIPGDLFRLAKQGLENKVYDLSNMNAHADAYGELAFGHSRQIDDKLRVGAKVKFLFGFANINAKVEKAQLELRDDAYVGTTSATLQTSLSSMQYQTETTMRGPEGEQTPHTYVSGIDDVSFGVTGFGLGLDLGAEYKIDDHFKVSAALLDLGFISWSNCYEASTNGERRINTGDYLFALGEDESNSFNKELDRLGEGLAELYELQDNGNIGGTTKALSATLNLGVEYTPDFYDKLKFGFVNSTRLAGKYTWTDFRFSANVAPVKFFSASASVSFGTYGASFGWLLNARTTGFSIFLGMDHTLGKLAKQGVPLSGRAQVSLGVNIPFAY